MIRCGNYGKTSQINYASEKSYLLADIEQPRNSRQEINVIVLYLTK